MWQQFDQETELSPDEKLELLLPTYLEKYGMSFSYFLVARDENDELKKKLITEIEKAMAGGRGAITDKELGFDYPKDVDL